MKIRVAKNQDDITDVAWYFDFGIQHDEGRSSGPGFWVNGFEEAYGELRVLLLDPYHYSWNSNPISEGSDRGRMNWKTYRWENG